jgi:hypothetical protein
MSSCKCKGFKKRIDKLNVGEYIVNQSEVHVKAFETKNGIQTFYCPFCKTNYNKNAEPTGDAKMILHTHSYNPESTLSKRLPHCGVRHDWLGNCYKNFPDEYTQFCIHK